MIIFPLLIILSAVLILVMIHNDQQSFYAMPMKVTFQGEYLTESGSFQPITNDILMLQKGNSQKDHRILWSFCYSKAVFFRYLVFCC